MAKGEVTKAFRHVNTGKTWLPGDTFTGSDAAAAELARRGYLRAPEPAAPAAGGGQPRDLSQLTVKELRALADELGAGAPAKATKARLIEIVSRAEQGAGDGGR